MPKTISTSKSGSCYAVFFLIGCLPKRLTGKKGSTCEGKRSQILPTYVPTLVTYNTKGYVNINT